MYVYFAGEFGIVHKAHYRNEVVAVKTLKGIVKAKTIKEGLGGGGYFYSQS